MTRGLLSVHAYHSFTKVSLINVLMYVIYELLILDYFNSLHFTITIQDRNKEIEFRLLV